MADEKFDFYDLHGVEECYFFEVATKALLVYLRRGEDLRRVRPVDGFVSPRLGIHFKQSGLEVVVYGPNNRPFFTFEQTKAAREHAEKRLVRLAGLSRKARRGQATAEELQELDRLEEESLSG
jgi:hypothetical protein